MGELSVELKRPDETVPGLKLTQVVTISIVVAPESLASNQQSILWIESITVAHRRRAPRSAADVLAPRSPTKAAKARRASPKAATACRRRWRPR